MWIDAFGEGANRVCAGWLRAAKARAAGVPVREVAG